MLLDLFYDEDMTFMLRRFVSAVTLCWRLFLCMTSMVIDCRSDDYF